MTITVLALIVLTLLYINNELYKELEKFKVELDKIEGHSSENDGLLGEYQMALSTFLDTDSACAHKFIEIIEKINTGE